MFPMTPEQKEVHRRLYERALESGSVTTHWGSAPSQGRGGNICPDPEVRRANGKKGREASPYKGRKF